MKLKKDSHLFIPFDENGKNIVGSYGSPYIYQSEKTAMKYAGRDAYELVEYAPIIHCVDCKHFVPEEIEDENDWEGTCLYNECYVDTGDFCSRGERRML